MPSRPARLPRRISHSTPPSSAHYRYHDDDHDPGSSRGRRRGSADDYHHRSHRRGRSRGSDDSAYHEDPRYHHRFSRSRRRGRSPDSEDDTYYDLHDRYSHRSHRGERSPDPRDSAYYDPRERDKYYHSGDQDDESPIRDRGRRRSLRHLRRSPFRSSATSPSPSSHGDFDRERSREPKKEGRLRRLARSLSRRGRRQPSVSSRSSSPSQPSRKDRSRSPSHSFTSKLRSKSNPPPPKQPPSNNQADIIYDAARAALEAGAVAALKLRNDPSPLLGAKGGKIAAAAIGAAVVDTFIDRRHPKRKGGLRHTVMRQATQMAIGNLVIPAVLEPDKIHGKKAPVQTSVKGKGAWRQPGKGGAGGVRTGGGRR